MDFTTLLTPTHLWEAAGALVLGLWGLFKTELQAWFKGCAKRWYASFFRQDIALTLTKLQQQEIFGAGLDGLETYLLLLLKEYRADRVMLTAYAPSDSGKSATCVVEVRQAEMRRVNHEFQGTPVPPALWAEIERWNQSPGRTHVVLDARLEAHAVLRAALRNSTACSAYHQCLPDALGECVAVLALHWRNEYPLTPAQLAALRLSGAPCSTMLLLMDSVKPPTTK